MRAAKLGRLIVLFVLLVLLLLPGMAIAQDRGLTLTAPYLGVELPPGDTAYLPLKLTNTGKSPEKVVLTITGAPKDWTVAVRDRGYNLKEVLINPEETLDLSLYIKLPKDAAPGEHVLEVSAATVDYAIQADVEIKVAVAGEPAEKEGLRVSTQYPVLTGPSGTTFVFLVDVENKSKEARTFDLNAKAPPGWIVVFRPEFERTKQISSLRIEGDRTRGVEVEVSSPPDARPGEYPVSVVVSSGDIRESIDLKAVVTGTYELEIGPPPPGRLNFEAALGKENHFTLLVWNKGTARLHGISFTAIKPEGWTVNFNPDRLEILEPDEVRQVDVVIRPGEKTIAGDYSLTLQASGKRVSDKVELRVTVTTPTVWGWVGLGIILAVLAGLGGIFAWLGRR